MDIPKVQVPMDFGVRYLGSPTHGNLKFVLGNGEELLANSMIVSYNSPVVDNLTTSLFQSSVEVCDFSKDAVMCFLEASYSGKAKITNSIFRDVNKMSHVFDVEWIADCCYFKLLTEAVEAKNYTNQLFVFEEAMFVFTKLKKRNFVELVIKKFTSLASYTESFVTNYLGNVSSCLTTSLDVIMKMTGKEPHILVQVVAAHLENNDFVIDQNTRYILEKLTMKSIPSQATHNSYRKLIKMLESTENPSKEDYKLIIEILKRYNDALFDSKMAKSPVLAFPNLFHSFKQLQDITDLDTLINFLSKSPIVTSSLILYDAVYSWLDDKRRSPAVAYVTIPDTFVGKFFSIIANKGWVPLPREYVDTVDKNDLRFGGLNSYILKNFNMITDSYSRFVSTFEYTPDELFGRDHNITLEIEHGTNIPNCNCKKEGICGFLLRVTAASDKQDNAFNIQLICDSDQYPEDIHFCGELLSIGNCHFALNITSDDGGYYPDVPVTWNGKPCRDGTKRYWCWGAQSFYDSRKGTKPPMHSHEHEKTWFNSDTAKITPVVYLLRSARPRVIIT